MHTHPRAHTGKRMHELKNERKNERYCERLYSSTSSQYYIIITYHVITVNCSHYLIYFISFLTQVVSHLFNIAAGCTSSVYRFLLRTPSLLQRVTTFEYPKKKKTDNDNGSGNKKDGKKVKVIPNPILKSLESVVFVRAVPISFFCFSFPSPLCWLLLLMLSYHLGLSFLDLYYVTLP